MNQSSLFQSEVQTHQPLAALLRPLTLDGLIGHEALLSRHSMLGSMVKTGRLSSLILWGPPGSGKTTLALALIRHFALESIQLNAVDVSVKQIKDALEQGRTQRSYYSKQTVLFFDEIHRLNRGQQDVLLPGVEAGDVILIGATTENPSYELSRALLSRLRVVTLEKLANQDLEKIYLKALAHLGLEASLWSDELRTLLLDSAQGDARKLISNIESCWRYHNDQPLTLEAATRILRSQVYAYTGGSEAYFDHLSALIKSVRGSDADSALYYLVKMLEAGEDPMVLGRRLVVLASEDIGNADPRALQVAVAGVQAVEIVGLPEARINLAQIVTYLSAAPKSNRSYLALQKAEQFVQEHRDLNVPKSLRSSRTALSQDLGYGKGYQLPHNFSKGWVKQSYWPEGVAPQTFYEPSPYGFEKNINEMKKWRED